MDLSPNKTGGENPPVCSTCARAQARITDSQGGTMSPDALAAFAPELLIVRGGAHLPDQVPDVEHPPPWRHQVRACLRAAWLIWPRSAAPAPVPASGVGQGGADMPVDEQPLPFDTCTPAAGPCTGGPRDQTSSRPGPCAPGSGTRPWAAAGTGATGRRRSWPGSPAQTADSPPGSGSGPAIRRPERRRRYSRFLKDVQGGQVVRGYGLAVSAA